MQLQSAVILVVGDEILNRMDVVNQLGAQGYTVLQAETGQQALETITLEDRVVSTMLICPERLTV